MRNAVRVLATTAVGMTLLSCAAPPRPGDGAAIVFGIAGFDIGAIMDSVIASTGAYVVSAAPGLWATTSDAEII